jgi:hypothetical protein
MTRLWRNADGDRSEMSRFRCFGAAMRASSAIVTLWCAS